MTTQFFTIGFTNGTEHANADAEASGSLAELGHTLSTFAAWEKAATEFAKGYAKAMAIKVESGLTQFARLMKAAGFAKPKATNAAAAKKAAQRATAKAAKGADDVSAPVAGDTVAKAIKLELNSTEAHLVSMLRAGKLVQCIEFLRDQIAHTAVM